MDKKAVELSMNTIVVAAVALIVLVVVVIIFTVQGGKFARGINDCGSKGGDSCADSNAECVESGGIPSGVCIFYDADGKEESSTDKNKVCCVKKS